MARSPIFKSAIAIITATTALALAPRCHAQDDWEVVQHHTTDSAPAPAQSEVSPSTTDSVSSADIAQPSLECGEPAVAASPQMREIVEQIDGVWGANIQVYQSVRPEVPHAMPGGCIFYNERVLKQLLRNRMDVQDPAATEPLLYAIMAHEAGHEFHDDFSLSREHTPEERKELEADRFSGYTLERLGVPTADVTPYYSMVGDEFGDGGQPHGKSEDRVAAFKEGFDLATWNRAEDSKSAVNAAANEPTAPDESDSGAE